MFIQMQRHNRGIRGHGEHCFSFRNDRSDCILCSRGCMMGIKDDPVRVDEMCHVMGDIHQAQR